MAINLETTPLAEINGKGILKETSKKILFFINDKFIVADKGADSLSNIFETDEYKLALDEYGQRFKATQLTPGLLSLIATIQSYKDFIVRKNIFEEKTQTGRKGKLDYYEKCKLFYNSLDALMIEELGLKKNNIDFEKILYYHLTDEINSTECNDLGKFSF